MSSAGTSFPDQAAAACRCVGLPSQSSCQGQALSATHETMSPRWTSFYRPSCRDPARLQFAALSAEATARASSGRGPCRRCRPGDVTCPSRPRRHRRALRLGGGAAGADICPRFADICPHVALNCLGIYPKGFCHPLLAPASFDQRNSLVPTIFGNRMFQYFRRRVAGVHAPVHQITDQTFPCPRHRLECRHPME
jgi:hypothetical protein